MGEGTAGQTGVDTATTAPTATIGGAAGGPNVLLLTADSAIAGFYRDQLPPGWHLETLLRLDDRAEQVEKASSAHAIVDIDLPVTAAHLDAATDLMIVQRQGVGRDRLDLDLLRGRGVTVATCPEGGADAVAEHAVLLMLAAGRHLVRLHLEVTSDGRWPKWDYRDRSVGLGGATVGIVGFGAIGQATARLVLAFGADVLVYRRPGRPHPGDEWPAGRVRGCASLEDLFATADVVSLHCPLDDDTRGLVDARLLGRMKPFSILVNTARGGIVAEDDLVAALRAGRPLAAGLDTLADEPPPAAHPLFALPNVVVTPHMATGTRQTQAAKAQAVFDNIARIWNGEEPRSRVL